MPDVPTYEERIKKFNDGLTKLSKKLFLKPVTQAKINDEGKIIAQLTLYDVQSKEK